MDAPPHPNRNLWPRNLAGRTSVVGCHGVGMTSVVGCHGVDQVKNPFANGTLFSGQTTAVEDETD